MSISGSIEKLVLDGETFAVHADADVNKLPGAEHDSLPTSGQSVEKKETKSPNIEGVVVAASPKENDSLEALAGSKTPFPMSITWADGITHRGVGGIKHNGWSNQENRSTIDLVPDVATDGWTAF